MFIPSEPNMLLSFINMKLRDQYKSLDDLIDDLDLDTSEIKDALNKAGIIYDAAINQLKFKWLGQEILNGFIKRLSI